jgi:hypothetical protein
VVAALTTEGLGLRSNQSGPQPSVPLAAEQRPATKPLLSVGAGVGFVRGPRAFAYWDRQQVTTGELTRPIQRVLALQGKQELLVAIEGAAPETTELVRVHPGGAGQPSAALPGLAVALAELPEGDSVAVLLHQGPLRVVSDLGRGEAVELELPPGARRALAVSSTGSHFAVGYDSGLVAVGQTRGGPARAVRVTGAPVSCIAFGRDERVLVVGDAQGQSSVLDLDSERVFPMSSRVAGPLDCAYDATRERYVFLDGQGNAWTQALDTTPLSFLPQVEDPLHMQLDKFRGLEAAP